MSDIHDLMIHVERIVRPVRARQARKLRMRRELFAHLLAAMEEERERAPDEAAALAQAKQRIGDPAEITRQLQQSTPRIERLLLANTGERFNRWEKRASKLLGAYDPPAFSHAAILYGCAALAVLIICLLAPRIPQESRTAFFLTARENRSHYLAVVLGVTIMQLLWIFAGIRFLAAVAERSFRPIRASIDGAIVLLMQTLLMLLIFSQIARRTPTVAEIALSLAVSAVMLVLLAWIGRWVARLAKPYDEWLALDITGQNQA